MSNIIQLIPLMNQKSERELLNIIHDKNNNIDKNETQNGNTALMLACLSKNRVHLAMALITTGKSNIEHVNNDGDTALTIACNNSNNLLQPVVKALINTGQLNPGQANNNGDTALILACKNKLANIATMLIQTNQSKPEHVNNSGDTALIWACQNDSFINVIRTLINTGQSNPGQVNNNGDTALIRACQLSLTEVAMALIQTGQSKPEQVNNNGDTALISACRRSLSSVAMALIQTGQSNPGQVNNNEDTALDVATKNNLSEVVDLLNKKLNLVIDISQTGFNTITQENHKIKDYIAENVDNICLQFNNQSILTSRRELSSQLATRSNIKYGCKTAGDNSAAVLDSNIIYDIPYFSMSSISGLQVLVPTKQIKLITENTKQLFVIKLTGKKVASIISQEFIDGRVGMGGDHCGTGKERDIYSIMGATSIESNIDEETKTDIYEETKAEPQTNTVKIQYSGRVFDFEIQSSTTIGDIKVKLLNELGFNESEYKVRVIFLGKMPGDSVLLSELGTGITLQALVNKIPSGGRKRKTKKRNCRKKSFTHKKNIRKKRKKTKKHYSFN
jgi:ankyrin repeat protein